MKDEGWSEDGRVSGAFSMTETLCSLQRLWMAALKTEHPPRRISILPPLLSAAVATAKLEIESVVTALIALCQNWASANCWSWEL